ncbi:MAG TPA: methyltransferase domain-containing protein [Actinomycetaceae bacterium]|nr:methyltransferase domain-containing protein [Actinomycetaceae bacterium]
MQCEYFDAGLCHSCSRMGEPYAQQLAMKDARVRGVLSPLGAIPWDEPVASPESGFRNKAKLVVGGTSTSPTLGILNAADRGVDLSRCGLYLPGITATIPRLAAFVSRAGLIPYDVPARRGELKHLLLTETPDGEFLLRLILRSQDQLPAARAELPQLLAEVPGIEVVSANLQPEHKAIIEGDDEVPLTERTTVPFRLGSVTLHLGPRAFFQTNTEIAAALYLTARGWLDGVSGRIVDLYCGVGGFAMHLAAPGRDVLGIEVSPEAVAAARRSAGELRERAASAGEPVGRVDFIAGDAADLGRAAGVVPTLGEMGAVVVNPPRRGIGAGLATHLERSDVPTVLYSSCNVESLARDLAHMPSLRPVRAQLFDMFPQTAHHEVMVLLRRD